MMPLRMLRSDLIHRPGGPDGFPYANLNAVPSTTSGGGHAASQAARPQNPPAANCVPQQNQADHTALRPFQPSTTEHALATKVEALTTEAISAAGQHTWRARV